MSEDKSPSEDPSEKKLSDEERILVAYGRCLGVEVVKTTLTSPVYNFDPDGWTIYTVLRERPLMLGPSPHFAIDDTTGEIRYLGEVGE